MINLPWNASADDRMAAIRLALGKGLPELADAIDNDTICQHCGGFVSSDGYAVDPDADCCFRCAP